MQQQSKILVVDDNPTNVLIMEELLGEDYQLATAYSGEAALTIARDFRPDVILLDIMMPGLDGYETCRRLRAEPRLEAAKIIMVSAKSLAAERTQGYAAGAYDYVSKPFEHPELLAKIRQALLET